MSQPVQTPIDEEKNLQHQNELSTIPNVDQQHGNDYTDPTAAKLAHAQDDAAKILREVGIVEFSVEEDRKVLRKIDLRVCLPMLLIYTLLHTDKASLSYAATFDLKHQTHLKNGEYAWLGSVLFCVQLVFQPLSAYALVKLPIAKWVLFNVTAWGISVTCMAAAKNFAGLMTCRVFIGLFEATCSPAFIAMTQLWWRRREQTFRNVIWLSAYMLAGTFGPLIAFGVGHSSSKIMLPYQAIFMTLGLITLATVPFLYFIFPDDIASAKFLSPREKAIAVERLRDNNTGTKTSHWKKDQLWEALLDPKTWLWGLMLGLCAVPSGGIGTFNTLAIKGFGFDALASVAIQIPAQVCAGGVLITCSWLTNKWKLRFPIVAGVTLLPIIGSAVLIHLPRNNPAHLLGTYYVVLQFASIQPLLYSWANQNAAGTTKQRVTGAVMFIFQCAGNVAGPQVYLDREAPVYKTGLDTDLACWSLLFILVLFMGAYLGFLNRRKEKQREAMGQMGRIQDTSIMTLEAAARYRATLIQNVDPANFNAHAYDDQTDFQNPDFIYVL